MEFEDVVKLRRSIRKYSAEDVSDDMVRSLIDCVVQAPSSMNGQPWHFIVVRDETTKKQLAAIKNKYCPPEKRDYNADFIMAAPVIIITCIDRQKAFDRGRGVGERERDE